MLIARRKDNMNETKKSQHTPGPWTRGQRGIEAHITEPEDFYLHICSIDPDNANARLIAAAPELLEVLEKWAEFMLENYAPEELSWYGETEAAISKARGGQNDTR
jgi:hypothetical protein